MAGGTMMIIVNFTGWLKAPANEVVFRNLMGRTISGTEYLALNEEEQERYILDSVSKTIENAEDVNYEDITIEAIEE